MAESGSARRIADLVSSLCAKSPAETPQVELEATLAELKALSRVKDDAQTLYTLQGIGMLCVYAFDSDKQSVAWSGEAKRTLANALTLENHCVPLFQQCQGVSKLLACVMGIHESCSFVDEFLFSRILFVFTAKTGTSIKDITPADQRGIVQLARSWLTRHRTRLEKAALLKMAWNSPIYSEQATALVETLKLAYNLSTFLPELTTERQTGSPSLENPLYHEILELVAEAYTTPISFLKSAVPHCINLLTSLHTTVQVIPEILFSILGDYVAGLLDGKQIWGDFIVSEDRFAPLMSLFSDLYTNASQASQCRTILKARLLVPDSERNKALGRSSSLAGRLLVVLNSASPVIRECLSTLLFQLSDSSPQQFVLNVGYGHAIGFLTAHGIAVPSDQLPDEHAGQAINPITGQNLQDETAEHAQRQLEEMTDEEKEREAEKLFVLFQRLKKNGIIDVKDPIQQAVDEGRFEEM